MRSDAAYDQILKIGLLNEFEYNTMSFKSNLLSSLLPLAMILIMASCNEVDDKRIPALAVNINLTDIGMWNTYGVSGFGISNNFILTGNMRVPAGFPYSVQSATGFGGVMLIGGMDPFTNDTNIPLAYDLSCPVECKADIRVVIDSETLEAVCPVCGSHYDVTMAGGSPVSGPAITGKYKYGLRRYNCLASPSGGYLITN